MGKIIGIELNTYMNNTCKIIIKVLNKPTELLLVSLVIAMLTFTGNLFYTYIFLQRAQPLENFSGYIVTPIVLDTDTTIRTGGTFDRRVYCDLTNFIVYLTNTSTGDITAITRQHMVEMPVTFAKPRKDMPITFTARIPNNLYAGTWSPEFVGTYTCMKGIFTSRKTQRILTNSVIVVDSLK
ncbi:hypothetical protein N8072_01300 [bacterium]|nr:hypothetical protein [bacterium]MDB4128509.1 hypothetical protein [bacterium]MDC1257290.1 hypothetical protein [bacterium]